MELRAIRALVGLAALLVMLGAHPAQAQMESREGIALQNQMLELQREIQALAQQRGAYPPAYQPPPSGFAPGIPSAASSDLVTRLLTRVDALEASVRELRGRVEQLSNQSQEQIAQLGKRIDDLQFQLQNPNTPAAPAAPTASRGAAPPPPPVAAPPPPPATGARRTPDVVLQEGEAALNRGDYATAEQDAREILAKRTSPRAYDARYLLARALMGQRQYSQAAIAFDDAYKSQSNGPHARDSLFGLAGALLDINQKPAACDTLRQLRAKFPAAGADAREREAQLSKRAGCR